MTDKIREAFDAWIASVDKRRDANGWEPLTARDVNMLREGYMEAALAQQPAPAVPAGWISVSERLPDHGDAVQVWCSGAECAGVAWMRQGAWYMPEPQAIGYDTITHWQPLAGKPVAAPEYTAQEARAMTDKIREAFEKFHAEHLRKMGMDEHDIATERDRLENGDYQWSMAAEAWPYWQAALAQQPTAAVPDGWRDVLDRARESIGAGSLQENANTERQYVAPYLDGIYDELEALENGAAPAAPVAQAPAPIKLSDDVREFLQEWIDSTMGGEDADVDYDFANQLAVLLGPLYTAPPAAEQPRMWMPKDELAVRELLAAINRDGGQHQHNVGIAQAACDALEEFHRLQQEIAEQQDHVARNLNMVEQPDSVAVPRELLDRAARSCANGWIDYPAAQELRALLAGGAE